MKIPWTVRRTNQSILKEINPECSLERLMLKLQYFGHLMQRASPLEKTLILGKTEGRRSGDRLWNGWMASLTQWTWVWAKSQDMVKDREAWNATVHGVPESWTQLSDWTTANIVVTVLLCVSSFGFVNICFLHLDAPMLDAWYLQIPCTLDELTPLLYNHLCLSLQSLA